MPVFSNYPYFPLFLPISCSKIAVVNQAKKEPPEQPKLRKGTIDYIEWGGTRNYPKAIKHTLSDVEIEERGSFYVVFKDGDEILRKKIGSNGTYVEYDDVKAKRLAEEELRRKEEERKKAAYKANSSSEAYALFEEYKKGFLNQFSRSGNLYAQDRKPPRWVYDHLNEWFNVGEKRIHNDTENERYVIEKWNGKEWVNGEQEAAKYQNRNNFNSERQEYEKQIDDALSGKFPHYTNVFMGRTSKLYAAIGLREGLPLFTTANKLKKANMPKDLKKHQHGLTDTQLKQLPQKIREPVMIMDSLDPSTNSIVVVTDMLDPDGMPIIVVIENSNRLMLYEGNSVSTNHSKTYYGREKFANFINNNAQNNTFLYINKKKSQKLEQIVKVQFLNSLTNYGFDSIIRQTSTKVNTNSKNIFDNFKRDRKNCG